MKLETIKKDKKKKIIIGSMIVLSVVGCITLTTTRAKYKSIQSIKLANGTIDYKVPDLKLAIKVSEDGVNYTSQKDIPIGDYTFNIEKSKCRIPTSTLNGENAPIDESVTIEYVDEKLNFRGLTKNNTRCYIYFDKRLTTPLEDMLAKLNVKNIKEETPDFSVIATGAETEENNGVFITEDPMYGENAKTYYWRGAATTNHIIFDDKCWRIVRINGDGSIRLIYNGVPTGSTCLGNGNSAAVIMGSTDAEKYYATSSGASGKSYYVGWTYALGIQRTLSGTASNAKTQTEKWYNINISDAEKTKVDTTGKFCNDRNVDEPPSKWNWTGYTTIWSEGGTKFTYAGAKRLYDIYHPSLSCSSGDVYSLSVGAISADEVELAGGRDADNESYYLNSGVNYWTMTPYLWESNNTAYVFYVTSNGNLHRYYLYANNTGLRPVINLRSDVTFNVGSDGTQNNPYIVQ